MIFQEPLPITMVVMAVKNLYGNLHNVKIVWDDSIRRRLFWGCWGFTEFNPDGSIEIHISPHVPFKHASEILAHELAHAVVGYDSSHALLWEMTFERIHKEYIRIQKTMEAK